MRSWRLGRRNNHARRAFPPIPRAPPHIRSRPPTIRALHYDPEGRARRPAEGGREGSGGLSGRDQGADWGFTNCTTRSPASVRPWSARSSRHRTPWVIQIAPRPIAGTGADASSAAAVGARRDAPLPSIRTPPPPADLREGILTGTSPFLRLFRSMFPHRFLIPGNRRSGNRRSSDREGVV
jgi:hypothetical protein